MFILLILLFSLLVALARGGNLSALGNLRPRYLWLLFIPLVLQLIAFSPLGRDPANAETLGKGLHLVSLAIAALALILNRHLPGVSFIALGFFLNLGVIALNGGYMPVSAPAREFAGLPPLNGPDANVAPMNSNTVLPFLGDILPLPAWLPRANVFSIGDVLITLGGILFLTRALHAPTPAIQPAPTE